MFSSPDQRRLGRGARGISTGRHGSRELTMRSPAGSVRVAEVPARANSPFHSRQYPWQPRRTMATEPSFKSTIDPEEAKLLWDEYKYRHEHCWTTLFRLTAAAVALGLAPYIGDRDVVCSVGQWLLALPGLALGLIFVGMLRMHGELRLLRQIKDCFRGRPENVLHFTFPPRTVAAQVRWSGLALSRCSPCFSLTQSRVSGNTPQVDRNSLGQMRNEQANRSFRARSVPKLGAGRRCSPADRQFVARYSPTCWRRWT